MSRFKIVTSIQIYKLVENICFMPIRQRGSHKFYRHSDGRTTVIPMHAGDLDRSLIHKILKDIEITIDDYNKN